MKHTRPYTEEETKVVCASAKAGQEYISDEITFEEFKAIDDKLFAIDESIDGKEEAVALQEHRFTFTKILRKAGDDAVAAGQDRDKGVAKYIMAIQLGMVEMPTAGAPDAKKDTLH